MQIAEKLGGEAGPLRSDIMFIAELETRTSRMQEDRTTEEDQTNPTSLAWPMNEQTPAQVPGGDPLDTLVEELRKEFTRGLARQAAQKEAMRRKRRLALTCLIGPGLLVAAALFDKAMHPRLETPRHEAHYGR
jgi:hypothetical protein